MCFDFIVVLVDFVKFCEEFKYFGSGGFCVFEGWVCNNNEGCEVSGLEYEVYIELVIVEGECILVEVVECYGVLVVSVVYCVGDFKIGDFVVWIGVFVLYCDEVFCVCCYIIDEIKYCLLIWKKEYYLEGDMVWVVCLYIECVYEMEVLYVYGYYYGYVYMYMYEYYYEVMVKDFMFDYFCQICLCDVGVFGQVKFVVFCVLVIGVGGFGVLVISYFVGVGVGMLGIVDYDVFDVSNLYCQVMYDVCDVGQCKVDLVVCCVVVFNFLVQVQIYVELLIVQIVFDVFVQYDLVVECIDDFVSCYFVSDVVVFIGMLLVLVSVYQYEGQLQVVMVVFGELCLCCLWFDMLVFGLVGSCVELGVFGLVFGVFGIMQVMEVLKLLFGLL